MKSGIIVPLTAVALTLVGCISAERKAEYAEWQASDDGVPTVMLGEFESKYRQGWRKRAEEKKKARLEREEAARVLASRQREYTRWLASDDKEDGVSLEVFEQKYKDGWEARASQKKQARLEREEKARQEEKKKAELAELQRKRGKLCDEIAAAELAAIREAYAEGKVYKHVYYRGLSLTSSERLWKERALSLKLKKEQEGSESYKKIAHELETIAQMNKWWLSDWLHDWVEPRLGLSEKDKLAGEALLSEFGNKYMPNAYANYEKVRDAAIELQQVFNEEFPEPRKIKSTSPKWSPFNKMLEKFAKVRTEYFLCHDELCHYWMSYRLGVLTAEDFVKIDSHKIAVRLLPENKTRASYTIVNRTALEGKDADFAAKYAPESYALYQRFEQEWKQMDALIDEVAKQRTLIDAVRFDRAYYNAIFKYNDLAREMNMLVADFQTWHIDHRTTEKSSEDVAKCDQERARGLKAFADSLPTYVKDRTLGRIIPKSDMVLIRECSIRMQRTEVTQMQWMIVMGNNPSWYIQPDCPVGNVSYNDCKEFIRKLNELDGETYRLPTECEWEVACRAGGTGDWGKRRNGEEGPLDVMGWYRDNTDGHEMAVALKEPNAWGLYDMHGNVVETCYNSTKCGGCYVYDARSCRSACRVRNDPGYRHGVCGFRLCCSAGSRE